MSAIARVVSGLLSCMIAKRLVGGRGAGFSSSRAIRRCRRAAERALIGRPASPARHHATAHTGRDTR